MAVSCVLEDKVSFEPLSGVTSIFFDDKSFQIFSVRSRGATGIIVKGFTEQLSSTFRLEDKGPIISIKLSPDQKVLSVQRSKSCVEFFNVTQLGANGALDQKSYEQSSKSKASTIIGFNWTTANEIVYFTSHGIEIYNVQPEKRTVKSVRYMNQLISWLVLCPFSSILVLSASKTVSSLVLFHLKNGNVYKLPKIDVDEQQIQNKVEVKEKDIQVFNLYKDQFYVAVIIHPMTGGGERSSTTNRNSEIHLYSINKDAGTTQKIHVLRTPFNGSLGLAMHSIDDVIVVHNRKAGETWLFDVGLSGEMGFCEPVGQQTKIPTTNNSNVQGGPSGNDQPETEDYPTHWVVFSPDIIIDANSGTMWRLKLKLNVVCPEEIEETTKEEQENAGMKGMSSLEVPRHISFLLQRKKAKRVVLDTLTCWCHHYQIDLTCIGASFDRINREYRLYIDQQLAPSLAMPASTFGQRPLPGVGAGIAVGCGGNGNEISATPSSGTSSSMSQPSKVILDQSDIYSHILSPLLERASKDDFEEKPTSFKKVIAIVIEYLRSLEERQIPAQHFLHELLINLLVQSGQFYQLHQLLQYHIISDSKPLACLLLSLEAVYPAAFQLAMDMLSRLKTTSEEEITEILLSKGKVISALIYAKSRNLERQIPARKFLQAAQATGDQEVLKNSVNWLSQHKLMTAKDMHDYLN